MKTIIYTCITNNYDQLREIKTAHQAICFTNCDLKSQTWEIRRIELMPKIHRHIKIRPHIFLPNHDINVWMDGNVLIDDIDQLITGKTGFWIMRHLSRCCIYQEAVRCLETGKDTEDQILPQINKYYNEGYPLSHGMVRSSFMIRDNSEQNRDFGNQWWQEVKDHSIRDQLSFNYVAWKTGLQYRAARFLHTISFDRHINDR